MSVFHHGRSRFVFDASGCMSIFDILQSVTFPKTYAGVVDQVTAIRLALRNVKMYFVLEGRAAMKGVEYALCKM